MTAPAPELCPLVKGVDARVRPAVDIQGHAFLAKAANVAGGIRIRPLNVMEKMAAVLEATRTVKDAAKDLGLENDSDFATNYRTACALQRACLHPDRDQPAWTSAAHLMRSLFGDELAMLMGHYTNGERLLGIGESELDAVKAEGLAVFLADADPNQSITHLLSTFTPAMLALLAVLLSVKVAALKQEGDAMRAATQELVADLTAQRDAALQQAAAAATAAPGEVSGVADG